MLIQEKISAFIEEIVEEQQIIKNEPNYLKILYFDHSHLLIDYEKMVLV
jgi:hypothetical protein